MDNTEAMTVINRKNFKMALIQCPKRRSIFHQPAIGWSMTTGKRKKAIYVSFVNKKNQYISEPDIKTYLNFKIYSYTYPNSGTLFSITNATVYRKVFIIFNLQITDICRHAKIDQTGITTLIGIRFWPPILSTTSIKPFLNCEAAYNRLNANHNRVNSLVI
jgi:hypothetical protein